MVFTPDQSQLIEVPAGDRGAPRIWSLAEIRQELSRRGLDWPAHVLRVLPENQTSAISANAVVTLDEGNLPNRQAAAALVREAGNSKDAKARELLERALQLDPDSPAVHNHLAWMFVAGPEALRDPQAAVRLARRAVELDDSQAVYLNTLGVALYRAGQYQNASRAWNSPCSAAVTRQRPLT